MSNPESTLVIVAYWKTFRPDTRQYKQQSIELEFNHPVALPVPAEYLITVKEQRDGEPVDTLALTPAGMRYVQEQFEKLFDEPTSTGEWDAPAVKSAPADDGWDVEDKAVVVGDDWGPDPSTMAVLEKEASETADWGDAGGVFDEDEPTNTPDSDVWNEAEEDWK